MSTSKKEQKGDPCSGDPSVRKKQLKDFRLNNHLTQLQLATKLGVSDSQTISNYERGVKGYQLSDKLISKFSKRLNVDLEYFDDDIQIPNNLPRRESVFIGRKQELSRLLEYLSPENRDYRCAITGVGGVGKSALALEAAWRCVEQKKFDAVIWFSAKKEFLFGNQITPKRHVNSNLEGLLISIIDVLDEKTSGNLPPKNEQLKIVKNILSQKKTLIIIDNFETIDDVEVTDYIYQEIPSPSEILVTDRKSFSVVNFIPLPELSVKETREIISDQCKKRHFSLPEDIVDKVIEYVGGIPLAIEWAIGQMSSQYWNIDRFDTHLKSKEESPLLEFLFSQSWKSISPTSKIIIDFLSYVPVPITGVLIKDINEIEEGEFNTSLIELFRFALIVKVDSKHNELKKLASFLDIKDSFKLLPLTKFFIRKIQGNNEMPFINSTGIYFYNLLATKASSTHWPSEATIRTVSQHREIYIWLIEELFAIGDYKTVLDLMIYVSPALGIMGKHDVRFKLSQLAIDAAVKINNNSEQARNLIMGTGWVLSIWGNLAKSRDHLERGVSLAHNANNTWLEAVGLRTLGLVAKKNGQYEEANNLLKQCEKLFSILHDDHFLSVTYGSLSSLARLQGDFEIASSYCEKAINKLEKLDNSKEILSIAYQKKAKVLIELGKLDQATDNNNKARNIVDQIERVEGEAHCEHISAIIQEKKGNILAALKKVKIAEELFITCGCSKKQILHDVLRIQEKAKQMKDST